MWHQPRYTSRLAEVLRLRRRSSQLRSMTKVPYQGLRRPSLGMLEVLSLYVVRTW